MNIIDTYVAQMVMAFSHLQNNPAVANYSITVNGQITVVQRNHINRLMRSVAILESVANGLRNGILATKRGVFYYYLGQLGEDCKSSFARELKRTCNNLNLPSTSLISTEPSTVAYGKVDVTNMATGVSFDLSIGDGVLLDGSILKHEIKITAKSGKTITRLIVVEKACVLRAMARAGFDERMNAILVTGKGFTTLITNAWVKGFTTCLMIDEDNCFGVCDFGPYGWSILHSYAYAKDPIKCENALRTPLRIVVTPAFMSNYPEAKYTKNSTLSSYDMNMFKFLLDTENKFFEKNAKARLNQLNTMFLRNYKCDLDLLDIKRLLVGLELAIKADKAI